MTYADEVMNPQYFGSNLADIRIQIRMSGWMSGVHQTFFKSLLLQFFSILTNVGTCDLCANTKKLEQIFEILLQKFLVKF